MKYIFILLVFLPVVAFTQQVRFKVTVADSVSGKPVSKATVYIDNVSGKTSETGEYEVDVNPGTYEVTILCDMYRAFQKSIIIPAEGLTLSVGIERANFLEETDLGEVTLDDNDFSTNSEGQNVSGLLQSSADAFVNTANFAFSSAGFRMRGYDSEYQEVYMNGIPVKNIETGRAVWSEWGGLNDALRFKESTSGITPLSNALGGVGGLTMFNTRASFIRKQNKVSYAISNKTYDNRVMYTYSTGLMENNWAFAFSGSKRWATEGFVEGTFYDAYSYFLSAEKKLNENHYVGLTILATPYKRGMQMSGTQEMYDLTGTNYYNSNWGYQNGKKRNARIKSMHEPRFMFTHNWKIDDKSSLQSTFSYVMGTYTSTYLNWYNAPNPKPDYYRYLPSYQSDPYIAGIVAQNWQTNPAVSQINWDQLYQVNYLANLEGKQANYIIEKRIDSKSRSDFASVYKRQINDHINISAGLEATHSNVNHCKVIDDLLGGEYWVDVDQFAEQDFLGDTTILQNDLNNPDAVKKEGDVFGYDYNIIFNNYKLWTMANFSYNKIDGFVGVHGLYNSFYREGNMRNGRYPNSSYGKSEVVSFVGYGIKAGGTYKITGRHYLMAQAAYLVQPPFIQNSFASPRVSNNPVNNLTVEKIISTDVSYIHKGINWNARVTAFQTWFNDQTDIKSFFHDGGYNTYVNMILTDVDKIHQGLEIGFDVKLSKTFSLIGAAALGNYLYTSRPLATINVENGSVNDTTKTIYQKYFFVSGTPQVATSFGVKYAHPKFWFVDLKVNYFQKAYLDFNPDKRSVEAVDGYGEGDPRILEIISQEELPSGVFLDASIGKSWRINTSKAPMYIGLNVNVNNVLNNTSYISGGYEQLRFDYTENVDLRNLDKFPSKYFYSYGRTYFIMVSLRF